MLEPSPLWAYVLLAGLFSCHPLLAQNAGSRAEWPFIEAPTFSTRGSLGGKDVKVTVTPTDVDITKRAPTAARTLRTGFPAARSSGPEANNLTLLLPVSKKRRVGHTVNVSLDSPAERDVHLQLTGKLRSNPRTAIHLRRIKGGAILPSPTNSRIRPRRVPSGTHELSKDEEATVLLIPKGAVSTSFTIETTPSAQTQPVELAIAATTLPRVVQPDIPLGPFLNGALPNRGPGVTLFQAVPAFPNITFTDPSAMIAHPSQDKFFVSERGGRLYLIDNIENTTAKTLVLDLSGNTALMNDSGLYNFVLHPNFPQNGYAYVYYTWKATGAANEPMLNEGFNGKYQRLSRFTYDFGSGIFDRSAEEVMIQFEALNPSHRGGGMAFGPNGFLYLAIGEQVVGGSHNAISSEFLSGIVRLDVDKRGGSISHPPRRRLGVHVGAANEISGVGYFVPSDNPFLAPDETLFEEFYCVGARNPYRLTYDAISNHTWFGDVGDGSVEELNLVQPAANFQYPFAEGQNAGTAIPDDIQLGLEAPATIALPRAESGCIVAGFVYRGQKFPSLYGKLIAGDYVWSTIWAVNYDSTTNQSQKDVISALPSIVGFGQDPRHGEIFCFPGIGNGGFSTPIYKLRISTVTSNPPPTLSATGMFTNLTSLEPRGGMQPYSVNMPLWSDGASKRRWIGLPSDGFHDDAATEQITFSSTGNYKFPRGTVFAKHFEFGERKVETRFLVNGDDGTWYGLSYRWRIDGSDADLVSAGGLTETISANGRTYNWRFPSRQECFSCHTSQSGFVLGFRTSQINSTGYGPQPGYGENYLTQLSSYGYFDQVITESDLSALPKSAQGWEDPQASLTHKVRSYLDSNCAHCHQPGTSSGRASWDARLQTPLSATALVSNEPIDHLGMNGSKLVMPGSPQGSILLHRMNSVHTGYAMPPLAKDQIDPQAVVGVADWIKSLNPRTIGSIESKLIRSADDLDLSGTLIYAVNVGGQPITVGDVPFSSEDVPGVSVQAQHRMDSWYSMPNLGSSPADVALSKVFNSIGFSVAGQPITMTLGQLIPGHRYKLQLLFMERCCIRGFRLSVNGADLGLVSTLAAQGSVIDGSAGSALVHEFLSSSDSVTITLGGNAGPDSQPILCGFTLEDLHHGLEAWDSDADELLDDWERLHASDLATLGLGDADNDGQSDRAEYAAGTNPRDAQSVFSARLSESAGNISLQWSSELGTNYRIMRSSDLSIWVSSSARISGTGGILSWLVPVDPTEGRSFFKIETTSADP